MEHIHHRISLARPQYEWLPIQDNPAVSREQINALFANRHPRLLSLRNVFVRLVQIPVLAVVGVICLAIAVMVLLPELRAALWHKAAPVLDNASLLGKQSV